MVTTEELVLVIAIACSTTGGYLFGSFSAENKIYQNCERLQQFKVDVGGMDFLYSCKREKP